VSLGLKKPGDFTVSEGHEYPLVVLKPILKDEWLRLGRVSNGMRAFHKELVAINNVDTPSFANGRKHFLFNIVTFFII
jgi:hypothetical protein